MERRVEAVIFERESRRSRLWRGEEAVTFGMNGGGLRVAASVEDRESNSIALQIPTTFATVILLQCEIVDTRLLGNVLAVSIPNLLPSDGWSRFPVHRRIGQGLSRGSRIAAFPKTHQAVVAFIQGKMILC